MQESHTKGVRFDTSAKAFLGLSYVAISIQEAISKVCDCLDKKNKQLSAFMSNLKRQENNLNYQKY